MSLFILTWIAYCSGCLLPLMLIVITLTTCKKKPQSNKKEIQTARKRTETIQKMKQKSQAKSNDKKSIKRPKARKEDVSESEANGSVAGNPPNSSVVASANSHFKSQQSNNNTVNTLNGVPNQSEVSLPGAAPPVQSEVEKRTTMDVSRNQPGGIESMVKKAERKRGSHVKTKPIGIETMFKSAERRRTNDH